MANANRSTSRLRFGWRSRRWATIEIPMGSIIAVVAVLLIHIDSAVAMPP
jgi:hypothetical protein